MKRLIIVILILLLLLTSCISSTLISSSIIPEEKNTIFLMFDNSVSTTNSTTFITDYYAIGDSHSTSLGSMNNIIFASQVLQDKGYLITMNPDKADLILLGGYTSNSFKTEVNLILLDKETDEKYVVANGVYGMGFDISEDITGALDQALQQIPRR